MRNALCRQARAWRGDQRAAFTADAVSAIGNGELCVFAQGPDIAHFYGPPLSAPDALQLLTESTTGIPLTDTARRERGTAIWRHEMELGGRPALTFTEFAAAGEAVYVRAFTCREGGVSWTRWRQ